MPAGDPPYYTNLPHNVRHKYQQCRLLSVESVSNTSVFVYAVGSDVM